MKKVFTLIYLSLIAFTFNVTGQVTRLVLAEEFTQASCPPCASQNPAFNNLLDLSTNQPKVVGLKYQTSWPGIDPMNDQTNGIGVYQKVSFYGVSGVPTACMDGQYQSGSYYMGAPANWTQAKLNTRAALTSPFSLVATHTISANFDSMYINLDITASQAVSGTLVAHVAVVERKITFCSPPGTNGETDFESVMREMLPDYNGTTLGTAWTVGQTQTLTFAIKIPDYIYDKNQLAVVAFIQDNSVATTTTISGAVSASTITVGSAAGLAVGMYVSGTGIGFGTAVITAISGTTLTLSNANSQSTAPSGTGTFYVKDVLQAAYSAPIPATSSAKLICNPITNLPVVSCGSALTPTVTFANKGSNTLTSLNIDYLVDGIPGTTVHWTGSVAPQATPISPLMTSNVTLPAINTSTGSHSLQVYVSSPNSVSDVDVLGDTDMVSYNVSGSTGASLPLVESFTAGIPANWAVVNADNGFTWIYSSSGYNSTGSALIDFYDSPNGQIDELWTPNYDFSTSGTTTATLDFDLAYAQYSTSTNDKLEIFYTLDCGQTWSTAVFNAAGSVLASGNAATTSPFVPTSAQWHHKTVSINGVAGNQSVFLKFKATSAYGNNLYIDNINITTNLINSVSAVPSSVNDINIYPNPSKGIFNIRFNNLKNENGVVNITNSMGALVRSVSLNDLPKTDEGNYLINLSNEAKGSYNVAIKTNDNVIVKRITIIE